MSRTGTTHDLSRAEPFYLLGPVRQRTDGAAGWAVASLLLGASLAVWYVLPVWFAPLLVVFGVAGVLSAIAFPFFTCLVFVALSFFRIHEAYPILLPLHLPVASGMLMAVSLVWHLGFARDIRPVWSREITALAIFFVLVTVGVAFAISRPLAWAYWSDVFWKIGITTLALAWLPSRPTDFRNAALVFIAAGGSIALVAVYNHWAGIDLVEGTRVAIGRGPKLMLGDPNDLALVLLFPMAFAAAIIAYDRSSPIRAMALLALLLILYGIVLTQSRGGLVGVLAIALVFGMRIVRSKILLVTVGSISALTLYGAMGIAGRVSGGSREVGVDESSLDRFHTWATALKMAWARPVTGIGVHNFADNYYFFTDYFDGIGRAPHSTWLGVLAETGFPGFCTFVTMVVFCWLSLVRANRLARRFDLGHHIDGAGIGILAGLVGFCASGTFLSHGFNWPIYILVALSAGFCRMVDCMFAPMATQPARASDVSRPHGDVT